MCKILPRSVVSRYLRRCTLERVASAQKKDNKSTLRYIAVNYLQSNLYNGRHKLRIGAYDERLYSDMPCAL